MKSDTQLVLKKACAAVPFVELAPDVKVASLPVIAAKVPPDAHAEVAQDLRAMLAEQRLGNAPLFVIDETTDLAFLREFLTQCWAALTADSPNRKLVDPRILLFRFAGNSSVPSLVRAMSKASTHVQRPANK